MKRIHDKRVVPAAVVADPEHAEPLAEALLAGGLDVIEVTLRTDAALACVERIKRRFPEMLVGAGTILTTEQVRAVKDAGGEFGVAPGLNARVVEKAASLDLPFLPGVMTASEVEHAMDMGCRLLKFFPAEAAGGTALLKALSAPYAHTDVRFVPLGGVGPRNAADYLRLSTVAAIGGSWLVRTQLQQAGDWREVTKLTEEILQIVAGTSSAGSDGGRCP